MELWSFTIQDYSNLINSPISIRDVDRKKATFKPSSNSIQYRAQHGHLQDSKRNCWGDSLITPLPQEPWNWSLDNQFLSRKWMETFEEQPLLTNQQLSQIPTGSGFQMTPSWEGPVQWSNQDLYLLILSFRLKHNRGTLKEKLTGILVHPSTSWMRNQCCLSRLWQVWPHQQPLIGDSKVSEITDPINSTGAPQPTSDRGSHPQSSDDNTKTFNQILPRVFLQFAILHPEGEWISDISCVQVMQWK